MRTRRRRKKEKTPVDTVNNEKLLDEDKLNNAVLKNDYELQKFDVETKKKRNLPQNEFFKINEKQIISSSSSNVNNNYNNIYGNDDGEEGPPINYEHFQQVNSKRPTTSYGGISARQKSLQNSLRQKSSRQDDKGEKNLINPFGMKNKLSKMNENFFGN